MLSGLGEEPADYEIIAGDTDTDCAAKAVALCAEGKANFLMKGILGTADLMRAVFNKEHGLRTSHLTTHCMFYEIPALGKMVILTDGGVNTFPDLEKKAEILENAAAVLQALGYEHINAACICGAEQVNPKVQSTVDADALSKMTDRWAKYNMDVCGPVALDLAVSKEACQHKHFSAPGAAMPTSCWYPTMRWAMALARPPLSLAAPKTQASSWVPRSLLSWSPAVTAPSPSWPPSPPAVCWPTGCTWLNSEKGGSSWSIKPFMTWAPPLL